MVTLIGIILVVVGLSDYGAATVIQAQQRRQSDPGGLGETPETPVVRLLKVIGIGTMVVGGVLILVGVLG